MGGLVWGLGGGGGGVVVGDEGMNVGWMICKVVLDTHTSDSHGNTFEKKRSCSLKVLVYAWISKLYHNFSHQCRAIPSLLCDNRISSNRPLNHINPINLQQLLP